MTGSKITTMMPENNRGTSDMSQQSDKVRHFQALHERDEAFIIPNPWDRGSARLLADAGFEALATTSAGFAFGRGLAEGFGQTHREMVLDHCREIVEATPLPVSADLEGGFDDAPAYVAETIRMAAGTGLAGGSIEDATGNTEKPIYDFGFAVERIQAAVEAARSVKDGFVLTARAENYLHGRPDLADTIARLQAFQEAGADVLYAPGLTSLADIETVVKSIDRPFNALPNPKIDGVTHAALSAIGVKRISVGSLLTRTAYGAMLAATREMQTSGRFDLAMNSIPFDSLNGVFAKPVR
tara:strand:+ start:47575 stop:48468 length:894 start_codon:yes stop_codon:yes gene_type:complete